MKSKLEDSDPYTPVHLSDEIMGIDSETFIKRQYRARERTTFINQIAFPFPIGMFTYERHGTHTNWIAIFKINKGDTKQSQAFIGAVVSITAKAPVYLS